MVLKIKKIVFKFHIVVQSKMRKYISPTLKYA